HPSSDKMFHVEHFFILQADTEKPNPFRLGIHSTIMASSFHFNIKSRRYNSRHRDFRMNKATRRVASPNVVSIEDLRRMARRRLPRVVFDYVDGGAEGEVTLRENCRAFQDVTFRPRHAVAIPNCD